MAMCPATFVVRLADHRVRHLTRIRARARDDRVWGETLRGGCPGQDSNLHGSCLPWDFKSHASTSFATRARLSCAGEQAARPRAAWRGVVPRNPVVPQPRTVLAASTEPTLVFSAVC